MLIVLWHDGFKERFYKYCKTRYRLISTSSCRPLLLDIYLAVAESLYSLFARYNTRTELSSYRRGFVVLYCLLDSSIQSGIRWSSSHVLELRDLPPRDRSSIAKTHLKAR